MNKKLLKLLKYSSKLALDSQNLTSASNGDVDELPVMKDDVSES